MATEAWNPKLTTLPSGDRIWSAVRIGPNGRPETFADERGVSCFDHSTLMALLDTAARKADPRRFTGEPPTGFGTLPCATQP